MPAPLLHAEGQFEGSGPAYSNARSTYVYLQKCAAVTLFPSVCSSDLPQSSCTDSQVASAIGPGAIIEQ